MKRIALSMVLVVSLVLPLAAHADEASRRAKAQEMVTLLHMDKLMAQLMDNMMSQMNAMTSQMLGSSVSDEQKAKLAAFQKQVLAAVDAQVGWKAMEPEYVTLYAQTYTDEELDGIVAFYKTPAGASMIAKTPELSTKSMQLVQSRMMALQPQLKQMVDDFTKSVAPKPATTPAK
jgi:hypothetical protein